MNDFEKINTDLATLFREGRALLDAGNSAVMNGCREEAFRNLSIWEESRINRKIIFI